MLFVVEYSLFENPRYKFLFLQITSIVSLRIHNSAKKHRENATLWMVSQNVEVKFFQYSTVLFLPPLAGEWETPHTCENLVVFNSWSFFGISTFILVHFPQNEKQPRETAWNLIFFSLHPKSYIFFFVLVDYNQCSKVCKIMQNCL